MNTNNPKKPDHHDRLLDTALREVVGQETPPDLSGKILAVAGEKSQTLVTLGDGNRSTQQQPPHRKRNFYIGAVLAASLLVAAGLMFPKGLKQASQDVAKLKPLAPAVKADTSQDAKPEKPAGTTVELPEFEMVPVETSVTVSDGGTVLFSGFKSDVEAWRRRIDQNKKEKLMMAVTPHIIIQEEEEERLGITDEKQERLKVKVHPVTDLVLPVPSTDDKVDLNAQRALELQTLSTEDAPPIVYPDSAVWSELTKRREAWSRGDWSSNKPAKLPPGQRFRIDASPGRDVHRYFSEMDVDVDGVRDNIGLGERDFDRRRSQWGFSRLLGLDSRLNRRSGGFPEQGEGPDASGDRYTRIYENPFIPAKGEQAVSTFSIDVDTASYANVRQFLMQSGQLPPPDAVRIEELVNYFSYAYTPPTDDTPFAAHVEIAGCPWHAEHRLVRVGIKGHEIATEKRPQSNLVFLIDVSGSMNQTNKLPLLVEGLKMLTRQLGENDRVAIVVYASSEGLALPSTRGDEQAVILAALEKLRAGGSTAGGAGIQLAYKIAQENFIEGGVNRVILATDGDFNVGTTSTAELERLAESNAKETGVFLTVLGFGRGNLNDAMMEAISGKGNGNYHYVDNRAEARKVLVEEISGTLVTIAKDVKIQIEFNPAQVAAYRLIGYENRLLETQDFNDDKKDAGEIGAGHTVTAIYEVVPAGVKVETPKVDALKYQQHAEKAPQPRNRAASVADASDELLTLKLRYKQPDGDTSTKLEFPIIDNGQSFAEATDDFKFASAVVSFGMLLRHSEHGGNSSYASVLEIAEEGSGKDVHGYRAEFLQLVRQAKVLAGE